MKENFGHNHYEINYKSPKREPNLPNRTRILDKQGNIISQPFKYENVMQADRELSQFSGLTQNIQQVIDKLATTNQAVETSKENQDLISIAEQLRFLSQQLDIELKTIDLTSANNLLEELNKKYEVNDRLSEKQLDQRDLDLGYVLEKLEFLDLTENEKNDLYFLARAVWPLLNHVNHSQRSKNWQKVNPKFKEYNWKHSMRILDIYLELKKAMPEFTSNLDEYKIASYALAHDTDEFLHGDIELTDQEDPSIPEIKQNQGEETLEYIDALFNRETSTKLELLDSVYNLGVREGTKIVSWQNQYSQRADVESNLVKMIDVGQGNDGVQKYIVDYINARGNYDPRVMTERGEEDQILSKNDRYQIFKQNRERLRKNRQVAYHKYDQAKSALLHSLIKDAKNNLSQNEIATLNYFFDQRPRQNENSFTEFEQRFTKEEATI